jgi:hypothetical protein
MKIDNEFLNVHSFTLAGKIQTDTAGNKLVFSVTTPTTKSGVYFWLSKSGSSFEVRYVGKAGSGPKMRMQQHQQGANKPESIERRQRIIESFDKRSKSLEIWFRESLCEPVGTLSRRPVSYYSTEEEALIAEFNPPLNRAKSSSNNTIDSIESGLLDAGGDQKDMWINVHETLDRKATDKILKLLKDQIKKEWKNLDLKVIGSYTLKESPRLANKCLLVFGKLLKNNFASHQKYFLITLEGKPHIGILNALLPKGGRNCCPDDETKFSSFDQKELAILFKNYSLNADYFRASKNS